jgi:hypothetical protein
MEIDAGHILEVLPLALVDPPRPRVHGAPADPVTLSTLAQHDAGLLAATELNEMQGCVLQMNWGCRRSESDCGRDLRG